MIPVRRWMAARQWTLRLPHLALVGAVIGFITGIVVSTGPINAPFFLAYGLVKGAYLSTEALGSLAVYLAKAVTFRSLGALPWDAVVKGLIIGSTITVGSFIAKRFVLKLDADKFRLLIEGLLLVAGLTMLWAAACVKFVSYNIQYGTGRDNVVDLARIARAVQGADVIALQEVERF
eukprot:gene31480-32107_t